MQLIVHFRDFQLDESVRVLHIGKIHSNCIIVTCDVTCGMQVRKPSFLLSEIIPFQESNSRIFGIFWLCVFTTPLFLKKSERGKVHIFDFFYIRCFFDESFLFNTDSLEI